MSPSPGAALRPRGFPSQPHDPMPWPRAPPVLGQPNPSGSHRRRGAAPSLPPRSMQRPPRPHRGPPRFQYNGMSLAPTPRRLPPPAGLSPGSPSDPEFSLEPKLHHVRAQDREMTEPPTTPARQALPSATVPPTPQPQARILHPPGTTSYRVISPLPSWGAKTSRGLPASARTPGRRRCTPRRRPQMHPRPFLAHRDPAAHPPYLALRLGLLPLLQLLLLAAAAARGS